MRLRKIRSGRWLIGVMGFALAACAGVSGNSVTKERLEAMLNSELNTGDDAGAIRSFFQRHELPYTYDASLRRYASTIPPGDRTPFSIYIYTDTEQKLTTTLVVAPEPQRAQRRPPPVPDLPFGLNDERRRPF